MSTYHPRVFKYTSSLAEKLGLKIPSQPWLHIAVLTSYWGTNGVHQLDKPYYAIYIWDTRTVVDSGEFDKKNIDAFKDAYNAPDNHETLKGSGKQIKLLNDSFDELHNEDQVYAEAIKATGWKKEELDRFGEDIYMYKSNPCKLRVKLPWQGVFVDHWLDEAVNKKNMSGMYAGVIDMNEHSGKMDNAESLKYITKIIKNNKISRPLSTDKLNAYYKRQSDKAWDKEHKKRR